MNISHITSLPTIQPSAYIFYIFLISIFLLVCIASNAGHAESYNPPPEYLLTPDELAKMEDMDPKDRAYNFIPKGHDCLRRVAGQHCLSCLFTSHLI